MATSIVEARRDQASFVAWVVIGVMIGNDPAQQAYEKAAFHVTGEKRHSEFERVWGCPGLRALTRPL
jgi:hypothetical protein